MKDLLKSFFLAIALSFLLVGCKDAPKEKEKKEELRREIVISTITYPKVELPKDSSPPDADPITRISKSPYEKLLERPRPQSWIWQYNGSPSLKKADLHVLDGFDHSKSDYHKIVSKGSFPVAYFSCSYEAWRQDSGLWKRSDKGKKMRGWDEHWPSPTAIKNHNSNIWKIYEGRLDYFKKKVGAEKDHYGIEWDNVDLYASIKLGRKEGIRFLNHLKEMTEEKGFVFALKNSTEVIKDIKGVRLYINESAQRWGELSAYKTVGLKVPVLNVEYKRPKVFVPYAYTIYYSNPNIINGKAITYPSKYR